MDLREVIKDKLFFKTLFAVMPIMALVADGEGRVFALNEAGRNLMGIDPQAAYMRRGGDVFNCIHRGDDPRGCGFGPDCKDCVVRKSAMAAIEGTGVQRRKGKLEIKQGEKIRVLNLLISSAPLEYQGLKLAVVVLEDISRITELEGLIPICACCKQIRDDHGYWTRLEKYIEERSEAEFTHDLCPNCRENLTADYQRRKLG